MKRSLRDAWVADLRANPNKQTGGTLLSRSGQSCCLGRLCLLTHIPYKSSDDGYDNTFCFEKDPDGFDITSSVLIPISQLERFTLTEQEMGQLWRMNDSGAHWYNGHTIEGGKTFAEIADWIENNITVEDKP